MSNNAQNDDVIFIDNIDNMFPFFHEMGDTNAKIAKEFYIYFYEEDRDKYVLKINTNDIIYFNEDGKILFIIKKNLPTNVNSYEIIKRSVDAGILKMREIRGVNIFD